MRVRTLLGHFVVYPVYGHHVIFRDTLCGICKFFRWYFNYLLTWNDQEVIDEDE